MPQLHYHCSIKSGQNINVIAVDRVLSKTERQQVLGISFIRTIRVPDNEESSQLPPDLGSFQLYKVQDYADRLPTSMVIKGGAFFPMHQREAMWINFEAEAPFMIKIYCGGVNVVSGEHMDEDIETKQRRSKLHGQGKPIQDYIVVPEQKWLDGVAVKPSVVRQFVAMPTGQGYTVESQITGNEIIGGLMFEVTPAHRKPGPLKLYVKALTGQTYIVQCFPDDRIDTVKGRLQDTEGIPSGLQKLSYAGFALEDAKILKEYQIQPGAVLQLALRLKGGGSMPSEPGIAAGGLIKQDIRKDTRDTKGWAHGLIPFSVQILDTSTFRRVTGVEPPACPIDAKAYADAGHPFYDLYEENPTDVSGAEAFADLQSINEIDMARGTEDGPEPAVHPRVVNLRESSLGTTTFDDDDVFHVDDPDGLLSPEGPCREFRTMADLEAEIRDLEL